jgi:hypothetical protein
MTWPRCGRSNDKLFGFYAKLRQLGFRNMDAFGIADLDDA